MSGRYAELGSKFFRVGRARTPSCGHALTLEPAEAKPDLNDLFIRELRHPVTFTLRSALRHGFHEALADLRRRAACFSTRTIHNRRSGVDGFSSFGILYPSGWMYRRLPSPPSESIPS